MRARVCVCIRVYECVCVGGGGGVRGVVVLGCLLI